MTSEATAAKTIHIENDDGPSILYSYDGYKDLLAREDIRYLVNEAGEHIHEYAALVHNGRYKRGPPITVAATEAKDLQHRLSKIEAKQDLLEHVFMEPAVGLFESESGCGSKRATRSERAVLRRPLWDVCWVCGKAGATLAHILPGRQEMGKVRPDKVPCLNAVNRPRFKTDYDFESSRNRLVLCGTKDLYGTCHYFFDHHLLAIIYDSLTQKYELFWFLHDHPSATELKAPSDFNPQRRGLAFHAMQVLKKNFFKTSDADRTKMYGNLLTLSRMSMSGEENRGDSESGDSVSVRSLEQATNDLWPQSRKRTADSIEDTVVQGNKEAICLEAHSKITLRESPYLSSSEKPVMNSSVCESVIDTVVQGNKEAICLEVHSKTTPRESPYLSLSEKPVVNSSVCESVIVVQGNKEAICLEAHSKITPRESPYLSLSEEPVVNSSVL